MRAQHNVDHRQIMLTLAKRLASPTSNEVATHGVANTAFWNHQAKTRQTCVVTKCNHFKPPEAPTPTPPKYILKLTGVQQPLLAVKPVTRGRRANQSQTLLMRWRPLARRALMTRRPPTVRMRARNPCVRARCRLLG